MTWKRFASLLFVYCMSFVGLAAEPRSASDLLLSDDFERSDLGGWKTVVPTFTIENGCLKGVQTREDHGAVARFSTAPFKNASVEFRFKLQGSKNINAVFDDKEYKGSHAGHICRVAFAPTQIRLGDDREGVMRNDLFEMRKDPNKKAEADNLLAGRTSRANFELAQEQWYHVKIMIRDELMEIAVNGQPITKLRSPGIAHDTKRSFHFTVNGPGALFDDVKIVALPD